MKKASEPKSNVAEKANAPFPTRLCALMEREHMKQGDLAALLNVTRQSANQYCLGLSSPDADKLCKVAAHFGVTTDYLLGMTDISSADPNMKMVCNFTGLSEAAVEQLKKLNKEVHTSERFPEVTPIAVLSEMISQGDNFIYFMDYVMQGYLAVIEDSLQEAEQNDTPEVLAAKAALQKNGYACFKNEKASELYYLQAMTGAKIICESLAQQVIKCREKKDRR